MCMSKKEKVLVQGKEIFFVKRKMKSIKIAVKENGDVVVSYPNGVPKKTVLGFVESKIGWIDKVLSQNQNTCQKDFSHGAKVFVLGQEYTIRHNESEKPKAKIVGNELVFWAKENSPPENLNKLFLLVCKKELKKLLPQYFEKWSCVTGLKVNGFSVRDMSTRWGSCNTKKQTISINVHIAEKPLVCLDYLVLHEIAHIKEPSHNQNFKNFLSKYMPNWKNIRKILKK